MSNLGARVASAAVMVPVILGAAILLPDPAWRIAVGLVAALAAREIALLAVGADIDAPWPLVALLTLMVAWLDGAQPAAPSGVAREGHLVAIVVVVAAAFAQQLLRASARRSAAAWALAVAVPAYIGGLAAFLARAHAVEDGVGWVLMLLFLVWTNDTMAYFGGRAFGRHPLAPALSPKKTWEGLAVGTAATVALAFGLATAAPHASNLRVVPEALATAPIWAAALGLAVAVAAPLGDLSHSFLKRQFGAKDSGHAIPGHGGVWDRTDSVLFAAPVVYALARLLGA